MDVRVFSICGKNDNYPTNDAEHCPFGGYHKITAFLFKGHNSAKNHSIIKPVKHAEELEVQINPVKF